LAEVRNEWENVVRELQPIINDCVYVGFLLFPGSVCLQFG
jgi:hypothetical protein